MTKYYEVTATNEGTTEVLYGSYLRQDCKDEIDAERDSWKECGYKAIKITSRECTDEIDEEVYEDNLVTKEELFLNHAPDFNFELSAEEFNHIMKRVKEGLDRGFITQIKPNLFLVNEAY